MRRKREYTDKILEYYGILNEWLTLKQRGIGMETFFNSHGYKKIAIYGAKELGERLYDELKETGIKVEYFIDKNIKGGNTKLEIRYPDHSLPVVDVIVVTASYYFEEIERELSKVVPYQIYSIKDILSEM